MTTISQRHRQTDRWTDGQFALTTALRSLRYASRGKNACVTQQGAQGQGEGQKFWLWVPI